MSFPQWPSDVARFFRSENRPVPADDAVDATRVLDRDVTEMPSAQTALDVTPGWIQWFPAEAELGNWSAHYYNDERIRWCLEQSGSLDGRTVLELGPLEGMHTFLLSRAGAAHIDAVEANTLAFVRCLIGREILKTANTSFRLGDFVQWLRQPGLRYDLIVASGVLYHSSNPIELLELIGRTANQFFLWTHYFDDLAMPADDLRRVPFSGRVLKRSFRGRPISLHERSYFKAWRDPKFCGGIQDQHYWMTKPHILDVIDAMGFDTTIAHDESTHVNGPCFSVFATRRSDERPDP